MDIEKCREPRVFEGMLKAIRETAFDFVNQPGLVAKDATDGIIEGIDPIFLHQDGQEQNQVPAIIENHAAQVGNEAAAPGSRRKQVEGKRRTCNDGPEDNASYVRDHAGGDATKINGFAAPDKHLN